MRFVSLEVARYRVSGIRGAAVWLLALVAAGCGSPGAPDPAGLVLVSLDTFRADHLGCAGNPTVRTPHLDRLERNGLQWPDAVTAIPLTTPSHATILSGRTPRSHGLLRNRQRLDPAVRTVAQELSDDGWRTGAVVSSRVVLDPEFGLNRGFDTYEVVDPARRPASGQGNRTADRAIAWLEASGGPRSFLWVHFFDAHLPYLPPAPLDRLYDPDYAGSLDPTTHLIQRILRETENPDPADVRHLAARYAGEVTFLDGCVGRLARTLESIAPRTRILVTADHGEGLYEHERYFGHDILLFETSLKVPFVLAGAGPFESRGRLATAPARTTDVAPTLLGLAGREAPPEMEGRDLGAEPERTGDERAFVVETHPSMGKSDPLYALRTDVAKVIWSDRHRRLQAFDLTTDPGEVTDLSDDPRALYRTLKEDLLLDLRERPVGTVLTVDDERGGLDEETRAALESLGYVDR